MPDPTYTSEVGGGRTVYVLDSKNTEGEHPASDYDYQNYVAFRDIEGNEIHEIISTGTLASTDVDDEGVYNLAPLGSRLTHITASAVILLLKEGADGDAAWTKITTEAHGVT